MRYKIIIKKKKEREREREKLGFKHFLFTLSYKDTSLEIKLVNKKY